MVDLLLHSGTGHPELAWIVVACILALSLGLAIGALSDRIRSLFVTERSETPDSD